MSASASAAFTYSEAGPQGLLAGRKACTVTATGGIYSEEPYADFDFQKNHLLHLLTFIGLAPVEQVKLEGTVLGDGALKAAIIKGEKAVEALLTKKA